VAQSSKEADGLPDLFHLFSAQSEAREPNELRDQDEAAVFRQEPCQTSKFGVAPSGPGEAMDEKQSAAWLPRTVEVSAEGASVTWNRNLFPRRRLETKPALGGGQGERQGEA